MEVRLVYGRRQILWFGVTANPTAEWIANQVTEACGWEQVPRYLIRDRDGASVRSTSVSSAPTTTTEKTTTGTTATNTTTTTKQVRAANEQWYPDHAVFNATKDQLKAMPQFKYN
jgi:hypothetical protein